jgi:hypothetical protein
VKANQKTLHRQILSQFQGKRHVPFVATDHEISHGRTITWTLRAKQAPEHIREAWIGTSWIVEVAATGSRDGKPFQARHLFLTSLRTTPEALLQLVRDRWSIEGWHWIRDTQLHEDAQVGSSPTWTGWSDHQSALVMQRPDTTRMGKHKRWDCGVKRSHRSTSRH